MNIATLNYKEKSGASTSPNKSDWESYLEENEAGVINYASYV